MDDDRQLQLNEVAREIEGMSTSNGDTRWDARELADWLGYKWESFRNVITRARATAESLNIQASDEFVRADCEKGETYKLTRFAYFLCVLHSDRRKPNVVLSQAILAKLADFAFDLVDVDVARIEGRERLTVAEKQMVDEAYDEGRGLSKGSIARFRDSGYRGLYNMGSKQLQRYKGVDPKKTLYDFVGSEELNANAFRADMTRGRIRREGPRTDSAYLTIARKVGGEVRKMVQSNLDINPEDLPTEPPIKKVRASIKRTKKTLNKNLPKPKRK